MGNKRPESSGCLLPLIGIIAILITVIGITF
jgi:hypothetical protein